jgi:hypothetical protein
MGIGTEIPHPEETATGDATSDRESVLSENYRKVLQRLDSLARPGV